MKILFVHQNFPGQFKFLAPELIKLGHEISSLSMKSNHENNLINSFTYSPSRGTSSTIHPWVTDFETKIIRADAAYKKCLELKRNGYEPNLIIAHPGWGESLFLKDVWPNAKLAIYCEFYYHTHGADLGFDKEFGLVNDEAIPKIKIKNINNLLHFEIADAGIAPTQWQASVFPESFKKKITVVHDGIDTDIVSPNPHAKLTISTASSSKVTIKKGDEIITFVNRNMEPYRGYHIFMRSLPSILKNRPNARVLIVGGDDVSYGARPENGKTWKDIFFDEVKNQLSDDQISRIHFLGKVPYKYFLPILQISSVHVYLTYPFVLSWSLIEAMSAGCPIVASDTEPVREAIVNNKTGLLIDFFDYQGLAEKVCFLLSDRDFAENLGSSARKFAIENYDLRKVCLPRQVSWVESLINC